MHHHYGCFEQRMDQKPVHQNENIIDDNSEKNINIINKFTNKWIVM